MLNKQYFCNVYSLIFIISILNKYFYVYSLLTTFLIIYRLGASSIDRSIIVFLRFIASFKSFYFSFFIVVFHHGIEVLDCIHSKPSTSKNVGELHLIDSIPGVKFSLLLIFSSSFSCRDPIIGTDSYA